MDMNKLDRRQMRKKAFEIAAGLIEVMDLEKFWGAEVCDCPDNREVDLLSFQKLVVAYLRTRGHALPL